MREQPLKPPARELQRQDKSWGSGRVCPRQDTVDDETFLNDRCKKQNSIRHARGKTELYIHSLNRKLNYEIVIIWRPRSMQPKNIGRKIGIAKCQEVK